MLVDTLTRLETARRHRCLVFLDDGVDAANRGVRADIRRYAERHADSMDLVTDPVLVPGGEKIKNELFYIEWMQSLVQEHGIDRHAFVIAVGGGAVLDAVGFVAATIHRGIRLIRVPTTVLAQNDSGVGVKNGINLRGSKNFLGTFAPPFAVLNDLEFHRTAARARKARRHGRGGQGCADPRRGFFRAGSSTMSTRCAIFEPRGDGRHDPALRRDPSAPDRAGGDPFESGSARPLDFGHWSAHKLETLSPHTSLRHGEAVAIGIALDTRYSVAAGSSPQASRIASSALLELLGF